MNICKNTVNINYQSENNNGKMTKKDLYLVDKKVVLIMLNKRRKGQSFQTVRYFFPNYRGHRCKS